MDKPEGANTVGTGSLKRPGLQLRASYRRQRLLAYWPFLVWLCVIAVAIHLHYRSSRFGGMAGAVETVAEDVAPLETSRLLSINVELGQRVRPGDVVARMDTSLVDAEIAQVEAAIFEAESSIGDFQRSTLNMLRQFDDDIRDAELALRDLERREERDGAQLAELKQQQQKLEMLYEKKLIGETQVNAMRPKIVALEHEVLGYEGLREIQQRRREAAGAARKDVAASLGLGSESISLKELETAVNQMVNAQKDVLEAGKLAAAIRKQSYTLGAARDGVVSRIFENPGNVVPAGRAVLRLVGEKPSRVVGFLPEIYVTNLKTGLQARVWRQNGKGPRVPAVVASIAPEVQALPGRASPIRGQDLRGRRVILDIQGDHDFIPGETVQVSVDAQGWRAWLDSFLGTFQ